MDVKFIIQVVSAVAAIGGLAFGLYQYTIAQKWKRSEFAAAQLEKLASDPELALVCQLLDWSVRQFPVPEKYLVLADEAKFVHEWSTLRQAMLPEEDADAGFDWQHVLYRDLFDHFFAYLERINHAISIDLISLRDVSSLEYWLRQIASPRFVEPGQRGMFLGFIDRYGYAGVQKLMRRFAVVR